MRVPPHQVYLLRAYRRWQNRYWRNWGKEVPRDLRFEPYTPPRVSVDCCRIVTVTRYNGLRTDKGEYPMNAKEL